MRIENARITKTALGLDGANAPAWYFELQGTEWTGPFGALVNDISTITEILNVTEAQSWEDIPNKFVRVKINDDDSENLQIVNIGHILNDVWVINETPDEEKTEETAEKPAERVEGEVVAP